MSWLPRYLCHLSQVLSAVNLYRSGASVGFVVATIDVNLTLLIVFCDITSLMAHWVWNLADILKPVMVFLL